METLQVQPAGALAPTLPAITSLGGTPPVGDSFSSTFGRALDDMPDLAPEGSSITPKAPPRERGAADSSSNSSTTAGTFLNCFAINAVQPAPTTASTTESAASSVSLSSPESTADSPPDCSSSFNTPPVETSANMLTFPPVIAPVGKLAPWAGKCEIPAVIPKTEAPRSNGRERGQSNNPIGGPVATSRQNLLPDTTSPIPVGAPTQLLEPQEDSLGGQPVNQQVIEVLSASKHSQTSNSWSSQASSSYQESPASPDLTDSRPQLGPLDPTEAQVASLRPLSQDSQPISKPETTAVQTEQAAPTPGYEAGNNPVSDAATGYPESAEVLAMVENPASQNLQSASSVASPASRVGQAPPAIAEASQSLTSDPATGHPELDEFSGLLGKFAGAEISVKVSGSAPPPAPALEERSTTKSTPIASGTLSGGLHITPADPVQVPPASKSEDAANLSAKATLRPPPVPGPAPTEAAWQNGNEPTAANTKILPSSLPSPVPSLQVDANSQGGNPATVLQKDASPEAAGVQPGGVVYANAGGSGPQANLADASTSSQGKSGQQSGQRSGDSPANVITTVPDIANNPAADPSASLLTAHAPTVPVSHGNTSTAQAPPSSNEPPATLSAWQNYDGGAGKIVRSASLSDSANGAEMHVELRTGALGPLELHAAVHEGSVGAEIHVQGQEAHTLLVAGLPSLERALGERNLRVENISIYQDQTGGGASGGGKQDPRSGSSPTPQRQVLPWDSPPQRSDSASGASEDEELANTTAGLSVRA